MLFYYVYFIMFILLWNQSPIVLSSFYFSFTEGIDILRARKIFSTGRDANTL